MRCFPFRAVPASRAAMASMLVLSLLAAPSRAQHADAPDLDALQLIKREAIENSQVMETLGYLTDVHGPRLTNSPIMHAAAEWAQERLRSWGLSNVQLEPWGTFGRGWVNEYFAANLVTPHPFVLQGYPKAWTPGTSGPVAGDAVVVQIDSDEDFEKYRGTLRGKFVLQSPMRDVPPYFESPTRRFTDEQLDQMTRQPLRTPRFGGGQQGNIAEFR